MVRLQDFVESTTNKEPLNDDRGYNTYSLALVSSCLLNEGSNFKKLLMNSTLATPVHPSYLALEVLQILSVALRISLHD
jgi:hypothetical protein